MYVDADARRAGIGRLLLASLARAAEAAGKELVSVDCETTNPEAFAFWSRWLRPVTWSLGGTLTRPVPAPSSRLGP